MTAAKSSLPDRVDVAIVGAGTAGAAAAALCGRRGLRVLCIDRRELNDAGARWVNGVPGRAFDDAGFARPIGAELLSEGGPFHLVAGRDPNARIVIENHGVLEVDMRLTVARLQDEARESGAVLMDGVAATAFTEGVLETNRGSVQTEVVVDASGLAGARLLAQPRVLPRDLCAAAQQVRAISDPSGARAFFDANQTPLGQVLCFTGIAGGYSILNVRVGANELDHVSILTGSIPGDPGRSGILSGARILEDFVAEQPWIGAKLFGGTRAIPLRRPFDRIATERVASIGDAACQVFPAHGSGIAPGMIAARILAECLADTGRPTDYATRWHRRHGGFLASYDLFRRFSQSLKLSDLRAMMSTGLITPELARAGMSQTLPTITPALAAAVIPALLRRPDLAARLAAVAAPMTIARLLYARYPTLNSNSERGLRRWSHRVARVFREAPDLG